MTNKKPILPLGLMDDGRLVVDPYPDLARLVIGAAGSAKTTSVIMPTAQALLGYRDISFLLNDCKSGECYSQLAPVAEKYNIPFGCIDDFGLYGFANPQRLKLNPFGAIHAAAKYSPGTLGFTIETATHCLIEEVSDGKRNFFFRETPRDILQTAIQTILELMPDQLYPGGLAAFIGDIETFRLGLNEALHDGSTALKARARSVLRMMDDDPDGFTKHYQACLTALKIYMPGSILATAGADADITHEQILQSGMKVCAILPQEHAILTGPHYALHQQGFREAQYSGRGGRLVNIVDEATNSPQKKAIEAVTTERAFKTASKYAAQTFVDFERVLGVKEAAILADNCAVKQYLSFNEADARKVSGQMGEEISLQQSVNIDPEKLEIRRSISTTKQAVMTPGELMNLDPVYQVIHLKGFGWLVCRKLFQNQLAPTCFYLGTNRWEGNPLPPDPKVELPVYQGGAA